MDFEAILNRPFRWPEAGDKLFQVLPDWDGNAVLADHPHSRMVLKMSGYKRAADRADRDTLVFPMRQERPLGLFPNPDTHPRNPEFRLGIDLPASCRPGGDGM